MVSYKVKICLTLFALAEIIMTVYRKLIMVKFLSFFNEPQSV